MIKKLLLSIGIFFILSTQAQKVKTKAESFVDPKTGKELRKDAFEAYDEKGNVTELIEYDKNGNQSRHLKYQYDSNGHKTWIAELSPDGTVIKKTEYKYDKNGNKTERIEYDKGGKMKSKKIFTYTYY